MTQWKLRFIIGGLPRSGTTLLRSRLDSHPDLIVPAETGFFLRTFYFRNASKVRIQRSAERLHRALNFLELGEIKEAIKHSNKSIECFDQLMHLANERLNYNAIGWGEKTPRNIEHFDRLRDEHEKLKFIIMIRDVRDVLTSRLPGQNEYHCSLNRCVQTLYSVLDNKDKGSLLVRYEDLVSNPNEEFARILNYLTIPCQNLELLSLLQSPNRQSHSDNQPEVANPIALPKVKRWQQDEHSEIMKEFKIYPNAVRLNEMLGYQ